MLETENLTKQFGGLVAVNDVSLEIPSDNQCTAIIGPNGAGKTTFYNLLSGTLPPTSGSIYFQGEDITDLGASEIANRGLVRSFQITELFDELTAIENVKVAVQRDKNTFNFWKSLNSMTDITERAEDILDRVGLLDERDTVAANLSHGEQRVLQIATVLGADPDMVLLDEPTAGLGGEETTRLMELIDSLADTIPILLVEHKMSVVLGLSQRVIVLHSGEIIADGEPSSVQTNERVQEVYLGRS